jgi:hypothetical protein
MKKLVCAAIVFAFWLILPLQSFAQITDKPGVRKTEGCVIKGQVYGFYQNKAAYKYTLPKGFDLKPYEGKKVLLEGTLGAGDYFTPTGKTLKILGPCDAACLKLISNVK